MKKTILLTMLLLPFSGLLFAQINSCLVFVNAFNSASQGFPEWRGNSQPNNLGMYDLPNDLFTEYTDLGLQSGMIYCHKHLPSMYIPGKFFDKWDLTITGKTLYPGDGITWDAAKEKYEEYFRLQGQQIHDACAPQLKLSPMLYGDRADGREKFVLYLYHPAYAWAEPMGAGQAEESMKEVAHIKLSFSEKFFPKGRYEITYEISGLAYEQ